VKALEAVGPNLTRANLKNALDSMTYTSDLANDLSWSPGSHFANTQMQAFGVGYTPSGFSGWRNEGTGWVKDQWVGQF
jgi:hypothetical protein